METKTDRPNETSQTEKNLKNIKKKKKSDYNQNQTNRNKYKNAEPKQQIPVLIKQSTNASELEDETQIPQK